jgi:hypothetical protein
MTYVSELSFFKPEIQRNMKLKDKENQEKRQRIEIDYNSLLSFISKDHSTTIKKYRKFCISFNKKKQKGE